MTARLEHLTLNRRVVPLGVIGTAVCGLLLLLAGCASRPPVFVPPTHMHRVDGFEPAAYRRLLMIPLENRSGSPEAAPLMTEALTKELQMTGRFEVLTADPLIRPGATAPNAHPAAAAPGAELALLPELVAAHRPDAILIGAVTQYRPYFPMSLGLSLRLVSAYDASTLAAVDAVWAAPPPGHEGPLDPLWTQPRPPLPAPAFETDSPRAFAGAVAAQIARSIAWNAPSVPVAAPPVTIPPDTVPGSMPPLAPSPDYAVPPEPETLDFTGSGSSTLPGPHR